MSTADNNNNSGLIGIVEKKKKHQPIPQWQCALPTGFYQGTAGLEGPILTGHNRT